MAGRPTKQGIDYFPMDVGFFSDVKIRKISRACGSQSASILICLLTLFFRLLLFLKMTDFPYIPMFYFPS